MFQCGGKHGRCAAGTSFPLTAGQTDGDDAFQRLLVLEDVSFGTELGCFWYQWLAPET